MKALSIISGSSHPQLADKICSKLGTEKCKVVLNKFCNSETNIEICDSVRDMDVYIIQTSSNLVNKNFMELAILIHACKMASAQKVQKINVVTQGHIDDPWNRLNGVPLSEYQKEMLANLQYSKESYKLWASRSGKLVANILSVAGADHLITLDLHEPQFQGFFDIPVDNLHSHNLVCLCIKENIENYGESVIVSPDAGGTKRASIISAKLGIEFAMIHREKKANILIGDVAQRECILIDDLADSSNTIVMASYLLKEKGASKIYAVITHGIFSGDALQKIAASPLDVVYVSDSIPQDVHMQQCPKIKRFEVAQLFAEAIRRNHNGESVSMLFDDQ
ncbi:of ribose phosphate pyrophosphokinase domain-containing protein [Rozella allomycis CSF55]|uniref:ribose-phosphate diphosphokinase n=1 Tax=Rozella allomycis (strain CSF55) TaxID=988480 RepID=A0A075B3E4_ROZAC|nr:of ribose phosphate pyrophosphokinase domain-containing protein [Rozella allomycis CSF55]|eukprot:EPZ35338.1 of ribose phosphate pyrophosphokinase domain-containing protein [Rozella allomycis CSF55]